MNQTSSDINPSLTDQAVDWCMRLHEDDVSEAEQLEFDHWFHSDNLHAQAYGKALRIWNLSAQLMPTFSQPPQDNDNIVDLASVKKSAKEHPNTNWHVYARVACFALFALPLIGWQLNLVPNSYQRYTAEDSRQNFTLPDGSLIELNLNSQLSYANYRNRRQINLNHGEAYFQVAHNKEHPFVVAAASGEIIVTGTRFNVWKYQDEVVVAVTEGSVIVKNSHAETHLKPGSEVKFNANTPQLLVKNIDTNQALAWRNGQLILDNISLKDAIPLINRYLTETPLILENKSVAKLRIGGIYHTDKMQSLVTTLTEVLPISLERKPDGSIIISN